MPLIHILDENTINQIAAGEVVERPSAIVKELIENAMDAGATAITAEIKEGGLSFIRITDNGSGIAKEDIPCAFLRHATSKIRSAQDLLSVTSLGFRGEALSSIAAVAQVELITKTPAAINGFRYLIDGGEEKSLEEIGCPSGTTIIVRNIFYNTPARRKFLKSAMTEAGYISDLMERLIVSHPEVSFKYIVNNQVKLQSSGNNNSKDILYHIYGRDISKELVNVDFSSDNLKVSGYIGKPIITRGNRNFENYFINGRYIKSNVITKAIEEAYKPFLMQHKYPFTSIYYEIDPAQIDVNVHPQKMEIRLKNGEEIYQTTYQLIRNALSGKEMIPKVYLTQQKENKSAITAIPEPFEQNRRMQLGGNTGSSHTHPFAKHQEPYKASEMGNDYLKATKPLINSDSRIPETVFGNGLKSQDAKITNFTNSDDKLIYSGKKNPISELDLVKESNEQINSEGEPSIPQQLSQNNPLEQDNRYQQYLFKKTQTDSSNPYNKNDEDEEKNNNGLDAKEYFVEEKAWNDDNNDDNNDDRNTVNQINDSQLPTECSIDRDDQLCSDHQIIKNDAEGTLQQETNSIVASDQLTLFSNESASDSVPFLSKTATPEHKIIGQVFATYWLVEYKKELYIIDQHAAHEKVLYEKLMNCARSKTFASQQLMPPIVLSLTLREQEILQRQEEVLNQLGYEFEHFGGKDYSVRAVPADLYSISEKELLLEFIDSMAEDLPGSAMNANSILERAASLSCKAAVKANHNLSFEEAAALIKELLTLENPYHCPHGRPVIVSMSQYELERKFKRVL